MSVKCELSSYQRHGRQRTHGRRMRGRKTVQMASPRSTRLGRVRPRGATPAGLPFPLRRCGAGPRTTPCPCGTARSPVTNVDPPDLTLWPTIRHLYPLWRAQWRLASIGLACAFVFTLLSLLIPILVQRTIDDAIDGGDRSLLVPYLAAIVCVASLRFVINFTRRYATARIGVTVEARLRGDALRRVPPLSRVRSTTATRPARSSPARRTTSTPSATSSAGASSRRSRA